MYSFLAAEEKQKKKNRACGAPGGSFGQPRFLVPDNGTQTRPMTISTTKLSGLPLGQQTHGPPAGRLVAAARVCQRSLTVKSPRGDKTGATAVHKVKPGQAA